MPYRNFELDSRKEKKRNRKQNRRIKKMGVSNDEKGESDSVGECNNSLDTENQGTRSEN